MKRSGLFPVCFFIALSSQAQIPVGAWRDHLSYRQAFRLADAGDRMFCATSGSLFYYNRNDHSVSKISTVNGLHDIDLNTIAFDNVNNRLIVGYKNGNIDLITAERIMNVPDIFLKSGLTNKTINHIHIRGNLAYLSCSFGISVLNPDKQEIKDTYYLGPGGSPAEVFAVTTNDDFIFAATGSGIFKAPLDNPNLVDFSVWSRISDIPNSTEKFTSLAWFGGKLFAIYHGSGTRNDHIYYSDNDQWKELGSSLYPEGTYYYSLEATPEKLVIASQNYADVYDSGLRLVRHSWTGDPRHALIDKEDIIWTADHYHGIIRENPQTGRDTILPNGPSNNDAFLAYSAAGKIFITAGGLSSAWGNLYNLPCVHIFDGSKWQSWTDYEARDAINVIAKPNEPDNLYVATWGYGIIYLENLQKKTVYSPANSSLQTIIPGDYCRVYGMAFDRNMNLWVTNSGVSNPISVLSADGTWYSLNYGPAINAPNVSKLLIDAANRKWVILPRGNGLFVFDDNGTPSDIRDDTYARVSIVDNAGNEISNFVYDIAEDLEGNIWVGTASGPVVFYNPAAVFEGPQEGGYAQQILVPRNDGSGLGDYLLSTETITSIAIDGANRKWFGTRNSGVFLISADGLKQIHHFTRENSPLLSNTINAITIDGKTGEVFFATDKGIISYRGTATSGGDSFGRVYAFPNPVRENYHGDITITGLARNVNVKITDISGNLVFETKALGGQAVWNGKNFDGRRVATGVYLVFCTNDDGSKTYVTKLLFIH